MTSGQAMTPKRKCTRERNLIGGPASALASMSARHSSVWNSPKVQTRASVKPGRAAPHSTTLRQRARYSPVSSRKMSACAIARKQRSRHSAPTVRRSTWRATVFTRRKTTEANHSRTAASQASAGWLSQPAAHSPHRTSSGCITREACHSSRRWGRQYASAAAAVGSSRQMGEPWWASSSGSVRPSSQEGISTSQTSVRRAPAGTAHHSESWPSAKAPRAAEAT
mmetsp:Transcript_24924/g.77669  ORF Transcript_24924/g.77669 Transcript_24924/m.77669 type:complete len:224 (+) Transcript_24924:1078-1749(+)